MKSSLDCKATESEEMEKSCLVEQKLLLRKKQEDYQDKNCGLFVRILPRDDEEEMHYYNRMLYFAREIYEDMVIIIIIKSFIYSFFCLFLSIVIMI